MIRQKSCKAIATGFAVLAVGLLASCSQPPPPAASTAAPADQTSTDGTVTFSGGGVAAGIGFQWGSGTLTFRGAQYPFRVSGLSVVDVGISSISASGKVRNLRNLSDFNGNYVSITAGVTVAGGAGASALRNQNGVVIDGVQTSQGLRLTLAPGGVNIRLTGQ